VETISLNWLAMGVIEKLTKLSITGLSYGMYGLFADFIFEIVYGMGNAKN
jgi:hypothetical protein